MTEFIVDSNLTDAKNAANPLLVLQVLMGKKPYKGKECGNVGIDYE